MTQQPQIPPDLLKYVQLTEKEVLIGAVLTSLQLANIANLRASCAEELIAMAYDPEKKESYALHLAWLQGKIEAYTTLLNLSVDAAQTLNPPKDQNLGE